MSVCRDRLGVGEARRARADETGVEVVAATFAHDEKGLTALCRTLVRLEVGLVAIERPDGLLVERLLDAVGNVLPALTLDPPRRPLTLRIRVQDQRHHHRRLIRRATQTIRPIPRTEHRQVHLRDHIQQTPRQMPFREPLPQRRRNQERLIPITAMKFWVMPEIVSSPPDRPL